MCFSRVCVSFLAVTAITVFLPRNATAQERYEIDNSHTAVIFSISHFNIGYVYGRFNKCMGSVLFDENEPTASTFNFSINVNSIDTNDIARDSHLKGEEFFDITDYPKIEFSSKSVEKKRDVYEVTGMFKMLGKENEITIPFQKLGEGKGPLGNTRLGMIAKFSIKRSEFGMTQMATELGDDVAITFCFQGIRK